MVVFTSSGHRRDVEAAARAGVDHYVMTTAEPVCFEELARALERSGAAEPGWRERVPAPPSAAQRLQVLKPNSA